MLACEACGFKSTLIRYEDDITEEELLACVDRLNKDADVDDASKDADTDDTDAGEGAAEKTVTADTKSE